MTGKAKKSASENESPVTLPALSVGWAWSDVSKLAQSDEQPVLTGPFGSALGTEDFIAEGVPLLTIGCLTESGISLAKAFCISSEKADQLERYRVRAGDLLFSRSASVGRAGLVTSSLTGSVINYHLMRLRLDSDAINPKLFIYYVRGSEVVRAYLRQVNHGATRDGINTTDLLAMPVAVPPRMTQERIVAKIEELFSDLDAGVTALKRAKANLKRYRAAVLKAAVEGKLTEEWRSKHPAKEPASALLARILKERRQKWEADQLAKFAAAEKEPPKNWREKYVEPSPPATTELPVLPDGWCWATIQQLAFVDVGFAFKSAEYTKEGIRLLRGENMEPGSLRWNDVRFWPEDKLAGLEHLLVKEGQIILAMDRPLVSAGLKLARVKASDLPCLLVQRMARLRMFDDAMTGFLHCSMQTHAFISHLLGDQTGTQLPHISGTGIEEFVTPLPPLMEQQQIAAEVAEKLSQIEAAETGIVNSLLRASRLRQSVLKQAFEGKLVLQDPKDEPASVLLERIRGSKSSNEEISKPKTRGTRKSKTTKSE
jgi:type I restriction enzyme S subunit